MTRAHKGFIILMVSAVGLWGCSQAEPRISSNHESRIKALEARCAALENECQAIQASRDLAQKKVAELEKDKAHLLKELDHYKMVAQECRELKAKLAVRTSERDAYQGQLEEVRDNIRSLLGRVEASLPYDDGTQKTSSIPNL